MSYSVSEYLKYNLTFLTVKTILISWKLILGNFKYPLKIYCAYILWNTYRNIWVDSINIRITSHTCHVFVVRKLKICSLSNWKECNTLLIVTISYYYMTSLEHIPPIWLELVYPLTTISPILRTPYPLGTSILPFLSVGSTALDSTDERHHGLFVFLCLTWRLPGSSMLSRMTGFPSFRRLLFYCTHVPPSFHAFICWWKLSPALALKNTEGWRLSTCCFPSFGCTAWSGNAGSSGSSICNFFRTLHRCEGTFFGR